jgi:hypothetical protein
MRWGRWRFFMSDRSLYSLTISKGTARRVRELARAKNLTVDQLINELMTVTEEHGWPTCSLF